MGNFLDEEYEKAHIDYIKRKNETLSKLKTIRKMEDFSQIPIEWIDQIIEFIKEKEI